MDRGARVWLDWSRTVIGGKAPPYDFAASFMQDTVGRILKTLHGKEAGTWFWTCYEGGANGKVSTKDEAVVGVERAYSAITRLPLLGDAIAFQLYNCLIGLVSEKATIVCPSVITFFHKTVSRCDYHGGL